MQKLMTSLMLFTGLITISTLVFGCSTQPHNESPWDMSEANMRMPVHPNEVLIKESDLNNTSWEGFGLFSTCIDRDGNPTGIKIDDQLPKETLLYRSGFRGGDVLKSINGTPISEIQAAKILIIKLRDEGVAAFSIVVERNMAERQLFIRIVDER